MTQHLGMRLLLYGALRRISLVALLVLISSCSTVFVIKPVGGLDRFVDFVFFHLPDGVKPMGISLMDLSVQESDDGENWRTVWELSGLGSGSRSARIDALRYGAVIEGLTVTVAATPLDAHRKYRVHAHGLDWAGVVAYGGGLFAFDAAGQVVVPEP